MFVWEVSIKNLRTESKRCFSLRVWMNMWMKIIRLGVEVSGDANAIGILESGHRNFEPLGYQTTNNDEKFHFRCGVESPAH